VKKILALPFSTVADFLAYERATLFSSIKDIEENLDSDVAKILELVPEIASRFLNLKNASANLRACLVQPNVTDAELLKSADKYLFAAYGFGIFRQFSHRVGMPLNGQKTLKSSQFHEDEIVDELSRRWEEFARNSRFK
jgi:hypothetical protein